MTRICIYGTVYNNVDTVEASIESVWRPDAEIVVVDSYSTDGTWERLLELRKEFNLKVYRYECTRGLGRHIALYKCTENSVTAWFDLDTVYNEAYHRVLDYALKTGLRVHAGPLVARRELILSRGGWRDLNYDEDVELVSRVGFDVHVPVAVGKNAGLPALIQMRERRYGGFKRLVRVSIDIIRGTGLSLERLLVNKSKRGALFYIPARLLGLYRNRRPDNPCWLEKATLVKSIPPREAGVSDEYFVYSVTLYLLKRVMGGEEALDEHVLGLVNKPVYKARIKTREIVLRYFKDPRWFGEEYLPLVTSVSVLS